jgi:plastocyanin
MHIRASRTLVSSLSVGIGLVALAMPVLAADQTVAMTGSTFSPASVTVRVGDTVTWVNQDPLDHDATATDGSWATPTFGQGGSGAVTFQATGTFPYYCTIHPDMTGTVAVQAAPATSPPSGATAPPTDVDGVPAGAEARSSTPVGGLGGPLLIVVLVVATLGGLRRALDRV